MIHELKIDHEVFESFINGLKPYEIRFNDRDCQVEDMLVLRETVHTGEEMKAGEPLTYTGRYGGGEITHILMGQYGLKDGWAILALGKAKR